MCSQCVLYVTTHLVNTLYVNHTQSTYCVKLKYCALLDSIGDAVHFSHRKCLIDTNITPTWCVYMGSIGACPKQATELPT